MKITLILLFTALQLIVYGQSKPDQQLIPDYVLKGKSANELRIMRNEIFARYGYIFNSNDLSEHFQPKHWYKPIHSNVDDQLTEIDKLNIERILAFEKIAQAKSLKLYENKSMAYLRVVSDPETGDRIEVTREVTFHNHCKYGTIKKTVERTFFGDETIPTVVYAETSAPNQPYWKTTKYFNDLDFNCTYYKAIKYGCCGSENYGELYNFEIDQPILKYNKDYYFVDIPNSKIEMFIGYNHQKFGRSGLNIATLYLSTLHGVVDSITFIAKHQQIKEDLPFYWTPKIELLTENAQNKISENGQEIELWSSNFAKTLDDVSGFSILIEFLSEKTGNKKQFKIPIIKGSFHGPNEAKTEIAVNLE